MGEGTSTSGSRSRLARVSSFRQREEEEEVAVPYHEAEGVPDVDPPLGEEDEQEGSYPGGPIETSVLITYHDHVARRIWEEEEREPLKMVNHARKIFSLFKPTAEWFNDSVRASGLSGLCMTGYTTISHSMQGAFVERWHKETSSFHLPVGEMTITLHDVQCLLHLPIRGPLFTHSRIQMVEATQWMALYLGMEPEAADYECITTSGPHIRFTILSRYFEHHLDAAADAEEAGDELFTQYHRGCALRCWYMHVVGAAVFVDKSARYVDVTYLRYFMDLTTVHQWNWGAATLAYLYQKLNEASNWRTRQLTGSCTLLTSWIIS
ncbi:protein MAIN-LIKE 1-like [Vicia villosa]|uniref:protein MAIN-LIKE 1-like n=1 Tax=Vicia villosa TaxID=3911 RepID=UPI00273BB816|nr:protein MAIN-LIKE 1-like [Vicia villosa]XP_058782690.1 protein MAIN-LIKE 1-like [Vicia villosa]